MSQQILKDAQASRRQMLKRIQAFSLFLAQDTKSNTLATVHCELRVSYSCELHQQLQTCKDLVG